MSVQAAAPTRQTAAAEPGSKNEQVLQRKCACGQHTVAGGECAECRKKRVMTQRWSTHRPSPTAMLRAREPASHPLDGIPHPRGDLSLVRANTPVHRAPFRLQRAPMEEGLDVTDATEPIAERTVETGSAPGPRATISPAGGTPAAESAPGAAPETSPEIPTSAQATTLIASDDATELAPGQLRKREFLDQLHAAVCAEAEAALAGTGQSTDGCPYLANWFDYYHGQSSTHVEAALRRYAPETRSARTAAEYIPPVAARVRQGVERWARTGEITGVPEGLALSIPTGGGLMGALGGLTSGIGSLLFKAREGGARAADDPAAVQSRLGEGRPLESGVRGRMERAFGRSLSGVRLHTDGTARRLSSEQNARAFTVGRHVAFGAGEYRPGTPVGEALIAHELAHTVQQQDGRAASLRAASARDTGYDRLEADADRAAAGVVMSLWNGTSRSPVAGFKTAAPGLRSGLRLQRCSNTPTSTQTKAPGTRGTAPGSQPAAGQPASEQAARLCDPSRRLTWADFQGTPTNNLSAWTRSHHELATENNRRIIRAVFEPATSWVQPRWENPNDRSLSGCDQNITMCEQVYNNRPPGGGTFTVPLNSTPSTTCPAKELPDPSVMATSKAECGSVLGPECDRVARAESARLLRHEQLHFDIACVLAQKGTAALAATPPPDPQSILNAVTATSNQLTNDSGNAYDTDTNHGCNATDQANWEGRVRNGLPSVTIP